MRVLLIGCAALALAAVAAGFAGAGDGRFDKFDLFGPNGSAGCDGGTGIDSGQPGGYGFAIIGAPSNDTVQATVVLQGVQPNTIHNVYLVQGDADCSTLDGTITTNGQGKGSVTISEPSVSSHVFVRILDTEHYWQYVGGILSH